MRIPIEYNKIKVIADYCESNISPRSHYLHNSIGGLGWSLYTGTQFDTRTRMYSLDPNGTGVTDSWYASIDDENQAILIRLKFGI